MKILTVYKTMYGSTKEYAGWISSELKSDLIDIKKAGKIRFNDYDTIIFGCYLFAFSLPVTRFIINRRDVLKNKNVILFTVSAMDPEKEIDKLSFAAKKGFPRDIRKKIKFFHFAGRYIIGKFNFLHRFLIKLGSSRIKDINDRKKMLESFDGVKKENIAGLVKYVKSLKN